MKHEFILYIPEAVDNPLVSFLLGDELLGILNLQEDLNSLKGGHHRLGVKELVTDSTEVFTSTFYRKNRFASRGQTNDQCMG